MKIVWVKSGRLLPVDAGGKLRSYNILRFLSRKHEVTLVSSYHATRKDEEYEREIVRHLPGAIAVRTDDPDRTPAQSRLAYLRYLPSRVPFAVRKFTSPEVQRILAKWIRERRFDVAVCDFLSASLNFPPELRTPTVLFQHNVESILWERLMDARQSISGKIVCKVEAFRMLCYERAALRRFHHVIAVSEVDRKLMAAMVNSARISVVPTGVDLAVYRLDPSVKVNPFLVTFVGSMDWKPNIDGVDYFCREIWPRILRRVPEARFRIVGRNPWKRVRDLASATVEVTGTVPSVVDHLRESAVVVVPLRVGGGTRLKILEAMGVGKAVVSTWVGAEGLDVHPGRDIVLCDDAESFAQAVVLLLEDHELRQSYEQAAAALAARYDWSVIGDRFAEVLQQVAELGPSKEPSGVSSQHSAMK